MKEELNKINYIDKYKKILDKINENIKYIKKNENFYIGKNNKLLPEYCHIIVF